MVETVAAASDGEVLFCGYDFVAENAGLEGGDEVVLVWAGWGVLARFRDGGHGALRTRWEGELRVLEVEVYDLCQRVHFCDFELADKLGQAFFELGICLTFSRPAYHFRRLYKTYKQRAQSSSSPPNSSCSGLAARLDTRYRRPSRSGSARLPRISAAISGSARYPCVVVISEFEAYHEALGVCVDPTTLPPLLPDRWLGKPDTQVPPIFSDAENVTRGSCPDFPTSGKHERVREGYEVFCGFGLAFF